MKAEDSIHPIVHLESTPVTQGIDLLTHMSIEFTKGILSTQPPNRTISKTLCQTIASEAIMQAKELIKQLNEEK